MSFVIREANKVVSNGRRKPVSQKVAQNWWDTMSQRAKNLIGTGAKPEEHSAASETIQPKVHGAETSARSQ